MRNGGVRVTASVIPMGTQLAASLHQRNMVETTVTCTTSSVAEMHAAELKTNAEIGSVMSRSSAMRGTMTIVVPTTTNLTGSVL
jgi:hypothetical protein